MCIKYKKDSKFIEQLCYSLSILTAISRWTWVRRCLLKQRMMEIIIIIITKEYDYGGVMSEDCKDTLQTK